MDHILSRDELEEYDEHIPKIPWLGYDHKPSEKVGIFEDYALQRGWSQEQLLDLKEGRLGNFDRVSLKPFLQSWFSIGLWEAALGRGLEKDAFIVLKEGKFKFTSEPLRQVIKDLQTDFQNTPRDEAGKGHLLQRFSQVLKAGSVWNRMMAETLLFVKPNPEFCDETYQCIMRMFALLGASLQYTGNFLARWVSGNFRAQLQNHWYLTFAQQGHLSERMTKRGWCPYIKTMLSPFNLIVAEYAAIIGPPATNFKHDSCSADACVRHNIEESTYQTMHAHPDCQCSFVKPDLNRIAEILDKGQIPLMDLNRISDDQEHKSVAVVPFEPGRPPFYAVSHVWSGGLGSTSEVGLPQCSVNFLGGYMESNGESKLVWIDSLCIPRQKRLRKLSIKSINKVYSQAYTTLVLDPELLRSTSSITRRMLLWVITSSWMQRMWTLPEGRLSKLPYFAFKNGAGSLQHLFMHADKDMENPVTGSLAPDLFGLFSQNVNALRYIHQSLCYRTTSKREDETPALAALFAINPQQILDTESLDERMALFWIALREKVIIPMNIIFLRCTKLPIPGLRWAPASLLNAGKQLSLLGAPKEATSFHAQLSDNGTLTATYVVIKLNQRATLLLNKFNPIKLAIMPSPGLNDVRVAQFTLLAYNKEGTDVEEEGVLEGIDAFAVNVTNIEAKAGEALANELLASVHSVIALSLDALESPPQAETTDETSHCGEGKQLGNSAGHAFRARYLLQLSPIETRGNEPMSGIVGWTKVSIS